MAAVTDHIAENKIDASIEIDHGIANDFDYIDEIESGYTRNQFVKLDADTEELDIPNFVGDFRALMLDDSENEVVLDSDDEGIQKLGKVRGNKVDASIEIDHGIAKDFDYTEVESGFMKSEFVNLDADTKELDIPNLFGDLRSLIVDDTEDEVVLDSDDEGIFKDQKEGKIRGRLWRHTSAVGLQSFEVSSSAGSNLTDKMSDKDQNLVHGDTHYQEQQIARSKEINLISNNEIVPLVDPEQFSNKCNNLENNKNDNGAYDESQEPGESSQANALEFVDHYLSVSVANLSPKATNSKVRGIRSPLASCVKGSKDLAVQINLISKIDNSNFNWDDNQPVNECDEELGVELLKRPFENDYGNEKDVSFDTQMAAETLQALLYAPPSTVYGVNQKESNVELPSTIKSRGKSTTTENMKKLHNRNRKVFRRSRGKKLLNNKVETFSPVATRTRHHGSSVKRSKKTEDMRNLGYITHGKLNNFYKRKLGHSDTFGDLWKWPKKRRTCRNTRRNVTFKSTLNTLSPVIIVGNGNSVVGPGETKGNFGEPFWMSNIKRKARSGSRHRSTDGNKLLKEWSMQKTGHPCLADVTNTKCASMNCTPTLADEKTMNDSLTLLKDQRVLNTQNVELDTEMIKSLVSAAHGQVMENVQQANMDYRLTDNILIHSVFRQRHQLFKDHVIMKRYARKKKEKAEANVNILVSNMSQSVVHPCTYLTD